MSTLITQSFNTTVINNVLNLNVPTPLSLETALIYAFKQYGSTSSSAVVFKIRRSGVLNDLTETTVSGSTEVYYTTSLCPSLQVSYHVYNANGTTSRVSYATYSSSLLANSNGYVKILIPTTIDSTDTLVLTTALGTNYIDISLINQKIRVQSGDYIWLEFEQQQRTSTSAIWTDNFAETSIADRIVCAVDLKHDLSLKESDLY